LAGRPLMEGLVQAQSRAQAQLSALEQRAAEFNARLRKLEANRSVAR
jgi:hypothetical protein